MVKKIVAVMLLVLFGLHYKFWSDKDGIPQYWRLKEAIALQEEENLKLRERNDRLLSDVRNLKEGLVSIETRARRDLGMVREGETFYQFVDY
uniref:Cell division protein FtsB n=1 Tax=Candidatus Kentrum sp. SD TaxID=2126332 RepID=A0A451BK64_9GAMM|nr:MAG: cell division protein FtsB [Candidatus Kentron sp. SD]VFK42852.1 MAG: cell division protein FtsB [Candidatus Kentron sp. SD]VFK78663.1 MAG: cell division protein FtsB [Candidatus Kentron sp. SD]